MYVLSRIQLCWEVISVLLTEGVSVFTEASVTHEILISGRGRGIKNAIQSEKGRFTHILLEIALRYSCKK